MLIDLPADSIASAVVLLSGGLDSCVTLAAAQTAHKRVRAILIAYGQTHARELQAARKILSYYPNVRFSSFVLDMTALDSALTDPAYSDDRITRASVEEKLPPSFVPGRNLMMLSLAAGVAYGMNSKYIYGGWNAVDYSGYPDCRPKFLGLMESAIQEGVHSSLEIVTPLVLLSKDQIIRWGMELKAPLHLTWSCYTGGATPCGHCASCDIRQKGFLKAGLPDPAMQ